MTLESDEAQAKLRSAWKLYSLPQTLAEIIRISDEFEPNSGELTKVILRDPALTTKLLKLANSAAYGQVRNVKTVNQAIVLLGFRSVKSLALSTAIYDLFAENSEQLGERICLFWRHSLEVAVYAQQLAGRIDYLVKEEAFVAGLLHDIGLIILADVFGEEYTEILDTPLRGESFCGLEDRKLGINHTEAAGRLFTDWGLPDSLVDAVGAHHQVIETPETIANGDTLTLLIALAEMMGHHPVEPTPPTDGKMVEDKYIIAQKLGLSNADLKDVDSWVSANLSEIAGDLEMNIGSPTNVLAEANRRLFDLFLEVEELLLHRRESIRREVDNEKQLVADDVLRVISATFSHYINNATTTIMGHAQLIEMGLNRGQFQDPSGRLAAAMKTIQNSVINITAVLDELKETPTYQVVSYHERSKILDVDENIRKRISEMIENRQAAATMS